MAKFDINICADPNRITSDIVIVFIDPISDNDVKRYCFSLSELARSFQTNHLFEWYTPDDNSDCQRRQMEGPINCLPVFPLPIIEKTIYIDRFTFDLIIKNKFDMILFVKSVEKRIGSGTFANIYTGVPVGLDVLTIQDPLSILTQVQTEPSVVTNEEVLDEETQALMRQMSERFRQQHQQRLAPTFTSEQLQSMIVDGVLDISERNMTQLPPIVHLNITILNCSENELTELPQLPNSLTKLYCGHNKLRTLPELPSGLLLLSCTSNKLDRLPQLPNGLTELYCASNLLENLPPLPNTLVELICADTDIKDLPINLPPNLKVLNCSEIGATELPQLPNGLTELYCGTNLLTVLPPLPSSLETLICDHNQLRTLPQLPSNLKVLICEHNQLISLPQLPDSLQLFQFNDNPNLIISREIQERFQNE